jgi:hypothetical protein
MWETEKNREIGRSGDRVEQRGFSVLAGDMRKKNSSRPNWPRRSLSTNGKEHITELTEEKEPVFDPLSALRQFPS